MFKNNCKFTFSKQTNMKTISRVSIFVLFLTFLIFPTFLKAQVKVNQSYADSLCRILEHTEFSKDKLPVLKDLCNLYWQQPESVDYLKYMIKIAAQVDSFNYVYASMVGLSRYYYNLEMGDSVLYWKEQLDSLSQSRSEYPADLYMAGNLICKHNLELGNYELAMNEAIRMLNKAKNDHHEFGLMKANESLALVYLEVRRDSDAVLAFREGWFWLNKGGSKVSTQLQYLSEMIAPCLRLNYFEEADSLLGKYSQLLDQTQADYEAKGLEYPVKWHAWWVSSFYSELYSRQNQLEKAHYYLNKAATYANASLDEEMKFPYYWAQIHYYTRMKNNQLALEAIDMALHIEAQQNLLKMKVDILRKEGHLQEALLIYNEVLSMDAVVSDHAFTRQIGQLRALNDLNDKTKQESDLLYQKEQILIKQHQLVTTMIVSAVLLILIYILYYFYNRTRRLKNELQHDKDSLVESEKQFRIAKEEAVKSNQNKTAFLSNISHEIRTPLNAIVGFSELLTDDNFEESDKKEFALMVNSNSELLMTLVNDVLDLSRLESGYCRFTMRSCDVVACCERAFEGMKSRVVPGVKLIFTTSVNTYILNTDPMRIEQVLTNLLSNAVKFTRQGEIHLTCEVDEACKEVRFAVSDTGCGIPVENQHRIFDRFEKLDEFAQGTGLGLSICKMITSLLGASLSLDTSYRMGARFVFIHPICMNAEEGKVSFG